MSQISFADAEYAGKRKKTRREVFLEEMEQEMKEASRELLFEKAARLRDEINALRNVLPNGGRKGDDIRSRVNALHCFRSRVLDFLNPDFHAWRRRDRRRAEQVKTLAIAEINRHHCIAATVVNDDGDAMHALS